MESYNLEEEKKVHPYQYYGRVFEEEHGNTKFLMRSALRYVIDDYDEYLSSIEQSHYEELNYNEVVDFYQSKDETTLDFTWMKKEDVIRLRDNEQYLMLNTIDINIDNLAFSILPSNFNGVNVRISALNSSTNYIQQIKAFRNFIINNKINRVSLIGFNKFVEEILMIYAKKNEIAITKEENVERTHRHM